MLMLKHATSLTHRSLNPLMKLSSKLLYRVCTNPRKVVGRILHIEALSKMTNLSYRVHSVYYSLGRLDHHSCPDLFF
jgi:hypothetical protein